MGKEGREEKIGEAIKVKSCAFVLYFDLALCLVLHVLQSLIVEASVLFTL